MNLASIQNRYSIGIFIILLTAYAFLAPAAKWDAMSRTRTALTYAIIDEGHLYIDTYQESLIDKALYKGHYYTPTSLGPSLLGLPVYAVLKVASSAPVIRDHVTVSQLRSFATIVITILGSAIPGALLGVLVFLFALRFTAEIRVALSVALIYGL